MAFRTLALFQEFDLLPIIGFLSTAYVIASYLLSWCSLRQFPGPFWASITYLWMFFKSLKKQQAEIYEDVNQKYGPVARIGPTTLITNNIELIRRINSPRDGYIRSSYFGLMRIDPYRDCLFSTCDTAEHDELKAKLIFGYSTKDLPRFHQLIDEQLSNLKKLIQQKYISTEHESKPIDMARVVHYFTLDVSTSLGCGKAFGYLSTDSDVHGYIATTEKIVPWLATIAEIPYLTRIFRMPWLLKLLGPKKSHRKGLGRMLAVAEEIVARRFSPNADDQQDMLGSFKRHGVSQRQCESELLLQLIAGSDTVATAIRATLLLLCSTPRVYTRLQREIDDAIAKGNISDPVSIEEGNRLEYLQAVIYEGLRVHIPFSGLLPKEVVTQQGDIFEGKQIPRGTRIAHNTLALQRDPNTFGPDVKVFRPERWLEVESAGRRELMIRTVHFVFGNGHWRCPGREIAFAEMNKIYVEMYH